MKFTYERKMKLTDYACLIRIICLTTSMIFIDNRK